MPQIHINLPTNAACPPEALQWSPVEENRDCIPMPRQQSRLWQARITKKDLK